MSEQSQVIYRYEFCDDFPLVVTIGGAVLIIITLLIASELKDYALVKYAMTHGYQETQNVGQSGYHWEKVK